MRSKIFLSLIVAGIGFALGWSLRPGIEGSRATKSADRFFSTRPAGREASTTRLSNAAACAANAPDEWSLQQVTENVRAVLREKNWLKRSAAVRTLVAETEPAGLETLRDTYNICLNDGWNTKELGELIAMREGQIMGKAGMDTLPAEPNGTPSYLMKHRMRGWASEDPSGGKAWLETLEPGRTRNELTAEWLSGMKDEMRFRLLQEKPGGTE